MAAKTIFLKSGRSGDPLQKEGKANAAITPGHLIELMTTGNLRVHATGGGPAGARFAIEDALQGKEIGDAYVANNRVQYIHAAPGDEVYAWLKDGESVAIGAKLESAGNGSLRASSEEASEIAGSIVAEALEAVDASASANVVDLRIMVEVV